MVAYRNQCVVTGCAIRDILHAVHIIPPRTAADHGIANGLILRADIHDLFERGLVAIDKDSYVWVHPSMREREYRFLHGEHLPLVAKYASKTALKRHRDLHGIDTSR
jgi:predicted restriction endonuclease